MSQFLDKIKNLHKVAEVSNASQSSSTEGAKAEETFVNSTFDASQTQTQKTDSSKSEPKVTYASMSEVNIFESSSESGATLNAESIFSDYESKLNDMLNKTMKRTNAAMTFSTIASGLSTAGDLLLNLSSKKDSANFINSLLGGSTVSGTGATDQSAQKAANSAIKDLKLDNDLEDAIKDFSKKGSDKHKASLQKELSAAEADRTTLAGKLSEQNSIIAEATTKQSAAEEASKQLDEQSKALQTEIDTLTKTIQDTAQGKIDKLDEDDKKQSGIITDSKKAVEQKKEETKTAIAAQNDIIADKTPDLDAMKTETYTDANGNVTTRQVPDNEKRQAAKIAIENAKKEIERLEEERDKFIEAEEKKQQEATDQIAQNAIDRSEQQAIIQNPKSDPEKGAELTAKVTERGEVEDSKSEKDAEVSKQKDIIKNASTLRNTCQSEMTKLSGQMSQARQLLGA